MKGSIDSDADIARLLRAERTAVVHVHVATDRELAFFALEGNEKFAVTIFAVCPLCGYGNVDDWFARRRRRRPSAIFKLSVPHRDCRLLQRWDRDPDAGDNCNIGFCVQEGMRALTPPWGS